MAWSRESRKSRGYGAAWDRLRRRVLERDGNLCQCQHCKASGRILAATEVDHVISKAKARTLGWSQQQVDDPGNLAAINADCHKRKTIEERGATPKPRVSIGDDGWPTVTG